MRVLEHSLWLRVQLFTSRDHQPASEEVRVWCTIGPPRTELAHDVYLYCTRPGVVYARVTNDAGVEVMRVAPALDLGVGNTLAVGRRITVENA